MNFTNDFHGLFREEFRITAIEPVRTFINVRGPWFWVHIMWSYAITALTFIVAIYKIKVTVRSARFRFYMVLLGCLLSSLANLFVLFVAPTAPIDATTIGATLGIVFLYFAMDTSPASNYLLARNQVFEALGEYIFVLDANDKMTDINRPAKNWLEAQGIYTDPISLEDLFLQLQDKGATIETDESIGRWEMFFTDESNSLFSSYTLKRNMLYGKRESVVGSIITFSDMTAIGEMLRNLREISTIDELTGTYNRRGYEKTLADYDQPHHLPLCVVMGDVNHLKYVNDTFGHNIGDAVLKNIARLLVECVGERGVVARVGGDEFTIILSSFNDDDAEELKASIRSTFEARSNEMHEAGIALGHGVKNKTDQSLLKVIEEADQRMYEDKRNNRRRILRNDL